MQLFPIGKLGRWFVLFLLGISLVVLPGCQPSDAIADDVIHLTLWHGVNPPPNRDVLQKLVDQFNRDHPKIQVESLYIGQTAQQLPKILAAVVGNAAPDLLWYPSTLTGQLVELNAIRALDDWWQQLPIRDQIDPALVDGMQMESHLWSIPFGTNNVGIYYRPSLFKAAGITKVPETWDELRQTAKQLTRDTNGDRRPDQHGMVMPLGKGEWTVFTWLPFMWSGGGELVPETPNQSQIENPRSRIELVNPGAIAALQLWQTLIQDGSAILSAPERGFELDGFLTGKVAMQLSGPWTLGQLQTTGVDFAVMPIPAQAKRATVVGGENLFCFKSDSNREQAALTFAEYVLSEPFQTQWAIGTGYLPVNLKSRQSLEYQAFKAKIPAVAVFLDQAQYGQSRPVFPGYSRLSENIGRAIEAVLMGKRSPQDALQESQQRIDLIFNQVAE